MKFRCSSTRRPITQRSPRRVGSADRNTDSCFAQEVSPWQAELQAGSAALVDPARLSSYAIMYARMQDMLDEMTFEQSDWAKLRTLENVRRLDPAATFELNETLHDARYRNWRLALVTSQSF